MTPSVPFAAFSDPIKVFDDLDNTYPADESFSSPQCTCNISTWTSPLDLQSYVIWHSRRLSLLYCSLTRIASIWYDRLPQIYKIYWSSFFKIFKKQFLLKNMHTMPNVTHFSLLKNNENVRHYALKI